MSSISLSVIIATRNRSTLLKRCLQSLVTQTMRPLEVIVVDNDSHDDTISTVIPYKKRLSIQVLKEPRVGIPYARNKGILHAKGALCAFIDDDCLADKNWVKRICLHFSTHTSSQIVIGLSFAQKNKSLSSLIEQEYYERWLSENVPDINQSSMVLSANILDFKNCAIRTPLIKRILFSTTIPFGDVGDEDVEIGYRINKHTSQIWYDPRIRVYHCNSKTIKRMLNRNYWVGYSNHYLLLQNINVRIVPRKKSRLRWLFIVIKRVFKTYSPLYASQYLGLLILYPFFSNIGRIHAVCTICFKQKHRIPQRN